MGGCIYFLKDRKEKRKESIGKEGKIGKEIQLLLK
jgi:hypothetical protein